MLLHSFYNFEYILKLPLINITRLLIKAKTKENENKLYQQWVINHATEFSFKDFKDKLKEQKQVEVDKTKTKEEIMEEVTDILNQFRR